jgi:hypothetical protein
MARPGSDIDLAVLFRLAPAIVEEQTEDLFQAVTSRGRITADSGLAVSASPSTSLSASKTGVAPKHGCGPA